MGISSSTVMKIAVGVLVFSEAELGTAVVEFNGERVGYVSSGRIKESALSFSFSYVSLNIIICYSFISCYRL